MKLEAFLIENTIESSSTYKEMSPELAGDFDKCIAEISKRFKGLKLVSSDKSTQPGAAKAEYYVFELTNGIVDLILNFGRRNESFNSLRLRCVLCDKFCATKADRKLSNDNIIFRLDLFPGVGGDFDSGEIAELDNAGQMVEQFVEWYFDLSGEYGKVKLKKTRTNALTGATSMTGSVYHWVAIAGQFTYDDQPANKYDIEAEVIK